MIEWSCVGSLTIPSRCISVKTIFNLLYFAELTRSEADFSFILVHAQVRQVLYFPLHHILFIILISLTFE